MNEILTVAAVVFIMIFYAAAAIFVIWLLIVSVSDNSGKEVDFPTKDSATFWIAREGDGRLYLYASRPHLYGDSLKVWGANGPCLAKLGLDQFPSVTFENSPQKVELKLIGE